MNGQKQIENDVWQVKGTDLSLRGERKSALDQRRPKWKVPPPQLLSKQERPWVVLLQVIAHESPAPGKEKLRVKTKQAKGD